MADKTLKLENANLSNFDPSMIDKGQEMIFTLRDTNVLDNDNNNNVNINTNFNDNYQIDEVKYKDTGIMIERYNENELMNNNKEKNYIEMQDNGKIDENSLLNKFKNIKNKIEKKSQNAHEKKKFQEEFYNAEELKLLNKKKNRKKKTSMILFDIDMNEEENKDNKEDKNDKGDKIDNIDINSDIKIDETKNNDFNTLNSHKKSLFTSEDKEKLESMFNTKKNSMEVKVKKNVINIDENLLEENNDDNNNDNNDNIRINKNKNYKVLDDYAIFLDNLPKPKNIEESKEKDESITNTDFNNNNQDKENKIDNKNDKEKNKDKEENKEKADKTEKDGDDEYTFKQDDEIPLISDEPIIGKGVYVALQIFKNKKMLRKEEEFGRYHDKKYENITNGVNEENAIEYDNNTLNIKDKDEYYKHKEINIEYRDENGKKLRPKEMARYQALIFHGSQSSVRKREKKLLREKYQVFVQNPTNNKTLNYMNFMKEKS